MTYEEKYNQALDRARKIYHANTNKGYRAFFEEIFPELAEDEDEKIRKGIIKYLEQSQFGEEHYQIDDDVVRNYISWLEKQGEQKLADKDAEKKELKKIDNVWVDLGLPSGTLWKSVNEEGYYTYDEAVKTFGDQLPTKEQFKELKEKCTWEWKENGYKVTGPNGNSIFLTALGYRNCINSVWLVGEYGYYWSSTPDNSEYAFGNSEYAWCINFYSSEVNISHCDRYYEQSIRLVKNK